MNTIQHQPLFTELSAEFEATPAFKELDDEVAATCIGGKDALVLYDNRGNTGKKLPLNNSTPDLGFFDNLTSSITIIRGRWEFYADKNYNKRLFIAGPGNYPSSLHDNQISSVRRIA